MPLASRFRRRLGGSVEVALLAAVAFVPLALTKPGMLAADTKQYLYLDPGRLLDSALSMWDPSVAGGTVTHQNIGYLFPQGPFYYVAEAWLRLPPWVAQRLWMGALLFVAGTGARYLARQAGIGGGGVLLASLAYELSPYSMQYIERISAILMPWAALGWMVGFTMAALRRGGWRYPALFAIVAAAAGGTNASSIVFVLIAPGLYVAYCVFCTREVALRSALATSCKIAFLTLGTALWWAAGLWTEGAFGIDVLIYTETLPAIASSSVAIEVLRGLGYWYFYGSDRIGPWLEAAVAYEERLFLLVTSFAVPLLGVVGAAFTRWRERAYFVALVLIGLVLAVGTHPLSHPSVFGRWLESFTTDTTAGLALRSSDRATPLVVLGLTMLLGAGASALYARARWPGMAISALAGGLVLVNAVPLFSGDAVAKNFERLSKLPSYDYAAAHYLDAKPSSTRVLVEPGEDFGDYSYGDTVDPIWPGIMRRPTIDRQQLIDGSLATADLLGAFDLTLQQGTYEPSTLAPIARLLSAGDMLFQSDLAFWRYDTPLPKAAWEEVDVPTKGIGKPVGFGGERPNVAPPGDRFIDEEALSLPTNAPYPPALAVFPVSHARPIDRSEPASEPLVLDGSGAGVVDAAATGLLDDNPTIIYAGSLDGHETLEKRTLRPGATLVVTDTNRKDLERFESENDNIGETLPAVAEPRSYDPTQVPLDVFGKQPASAQTVAQYAGAVYVTASSYGNSVGETPEDRPYMAFDDNPATAWSTAAFGDAKGQWLEVRLAKPVTTSQLRLSQVLGTSQNRFVTKVTVSFDHARPLTFSLGRASRSEKGEVLSFKKRSFDLLRIRLDATSWKKHSLTGASGVGFSSVKIKGVHLFEWIRLPEDLLDDVGRASSAHRLVLLFTRDRVSPYPPRSSPEQFIARRFSLPTARTFSLSGTARISALIPDNVIDELLGGADVFGGTVVGSNERLPGDLDARAAFAFDGNPKTSWSPGFDTAAQLHAWLEASLPAPISFDHMDLALVADGRHSLPTEMRITSNEGGSDLVRIPPVKDEKKAGSVVTVPLSFPRLFGTTFRFSIVKIDKLTTIDWYSQKPITLPVAIAEMGVPGIHVTPEDRSAQIPAICRGNLLKIDGKPVYLKVTGSVGEAEEGDGLSVTGCGPDRKGLRLKAGTHDLLATSGQLSGFDLDQLALDSAPGGAPEPLAAGGTLRPVAGTIGRGKLHSPPLRVVSSDATSASLELRGVRKGHPFWLVLGESYNRGWTATAGGRALGSASLIDGYANGWYVDPARSGAMVVTLDFAPQRLVAAALVASAVFLWICLVLAVLPEEKRRAVARRLRRRKRSEAVSPSGTTVSSSAGEAPVLGRPASGEGRPRLVSRLGAGLVGGALAFGALPHQVALPVALAVAILVASSWRLASARLVLGLAAVALVAAGGAYVVQHQLVSHAPPGSGWPTRLNAAGIMAFVGVVVLFADSLCEVVRGREETTATRRHRRQRRRRA